MKAVLIVVALVFILAVFLWYKVRRMSVKIDGCKITFARDLEHSWVVYREPSGRTLTFEAYGPQNDEPLWVEDAARWEDLTPEAKTKLAAVNISDSLYQTISRQEADLVRQRISAGLTRLKIPHEFIRPKRSGWTSFENGKEIYHG